MTVFVPAFSNFNFQSCLPKMSRPKMALAVSVLMVLAEAIQAQTLADLGAAAPTPGTNDVAQLSTVGNQTAPDNLNYYTDNQSDHGAGEPGQTFTTGTNSTGYVLTSLAIKTGGLGSSTYSGIGTAQPYYLHIYSVSGSTATLLQTYTSANFTFSDGDWLKWSGLSVPMAAQTNYAWSFGKASSTTGWEPLAVATNNYYAGGEIGLVPTAGGTIAFGGSHGFDAVFDVGLTLATQPSVNQITVSPTNNVYAGTAVTFTAGTSGAQPLYFQWQFSSGGGYTNISGANTNTLGLTAAITNTGSYQLVVTNSYGAVTSAPVTLTVTATTINQLTVSPMNNVFVGTPVTFTTSVSGAPPLYLQWQFSNGGGYTNISGANTNTLMFNAAVTNTGLYELVVTNSYGAVTSAPVALSVTLDTNPPVVLNGFNLGTTNVEVDFSKALEAASATNPANYIFTNGLAITAASLTPNNLSVILTTAPLVYGSNYTLIINGVRDQAVPPNTIATNTQVCFTASPRQRILIDSAWHFQLGDPGDVTTNVTVYPEIGDLTKLQDPTAEVTLEATRPDPVATHAGENVSYVQTNYNDSGWQQINLPHDWVVGLPFDSSAAQNHGYKAGISGSTSANTIAWYRHTFTLPAGDAGKTVWLEFDGIYRNALIWLNGRCIGRDVSGYAPIAFDVTTNVIAGGTNVLVVRVDASRFEGWFYEGAGIYRHVWLTMENPVHVAEWGTYVATSSLVGSNATITVQTTVTNQGSATTVNGTLTSTLLDANSNAVITVTSNLTLIAGQGLVVTQTLAVANANLWSLQTPYLYKLVSTVSNAAALADVYNTTFGVRMVSFDPTNGVFVNGQHVWIQGMCNHQDMAGVGSALPDRLQYFRIEKLKEMGCNAYRTSHNAPTAELLDACDRLGMLVLDETRRMGSDPESLGQLQRMVLRDRNHPSVFCWSLCNEEWTMQGSSSGPGVIQAMQNLVHSLDATRLCTAAINGSLSGVTFAYVLDVKGLNYNIPGNLDSYHPGNPNSPIIGTEVGSTVTTRGIYTNDTSAGYCASYDIQNSGVGWGEPAETWWQIYYARPWASGGFNWTGFDYRGEPTPYNWPCINSHFGIMDTCGFPKDLFYYYQANWTIKPVLHVFPHWNWTTPGQPINVWAYGNCQTVELFVNGVSQGKQTLNVQGHVEWDNVTYAAGTLQAVGYNNNVAVITNTVVTTGTPATIALVPDRSTILADGRDVSVVSVAVLDSLGRVVPTATNNISFSITGGTILGVGNGNPSSHEADKASQRQVFNGLAEVIIQSASQPGSITLTATSTGLTSTNITITKAATLPPPAAPKGVLAVGGNAQVTVTWDIVPGATTYNLWRATTSGGPYTLIAGNIGGVNLGYTDSNVTNLTTYYYVVTANGNGASLNSAQVSATPAAMVTGLTATITSGQIALNWNGSPGANYNVKRSLVTGGPYTTIATSIATTNYTDSSAATCQTYFYVVTVTNAGNESLPSAEVSAALPGVLPPQFTSADVGGPGLAGSASFCGGQFAVSGSGADIWNTADAFQFVYVYVPISTNCDIRARVVNISYTDPWAKAGVMIRESLAAGACNAYMAISYTNGATFQYRSATGGSSANTAVTGIGAPYWVRVTRTNNTFQAYRSSDGTTWNAVGSATTISMAGTGAYIGLAVTAHNNTLLNTSFFDSVSASFLPTNIAPTLAPIANQTVNVGQTAAITANASDTNYSPRTLIYSQLIGPASATLTKLNNTNAAFSWRPQVTDASTINPVTLKVTDSTSPSLSATQSFTITVNPLALPAVPSAGWSNGQFTLRVTNSIIGPDYAVQGSSNLVNWNTLFITNSPPTNSFQWTDTNALMLPMQFYRIKIGPPLP